MGFTTEELALYGLIDAETYTRLTEAAISGGVAALGRWEYFTAERRERIRMRAAEIWRRRRVRAD
jgi:hypothetical protein